MDWTDLLPLPPGLTAVTGDEGTGKTRLLRTLGEQRGTDHDALWLDLSLPGQDDLLPRQVWQALELRCPNWDAALLADLVQALGLEVHVDKQLFKLSTGSRRKVGLAGLLAGGATLTCLDQPFAALDAASVNTVRDFLADAAGHPTRTWIVADYEADPNLPWRKHIVLDAR
jgi:ABC-type transport system involved in cytochrome c biogenesis ATPase subunit